MKLYNLANAPATSLRVYGSPWCALRAAILDFIPDKSPIALEKIIRAFRSDAFNRNDIIDALRGMASTDRPLIVFAPCGTSVVVYRVEIAAGRKASDTSLGAGGCE